MIQPRVILVFVFGCFGVGGCAGPKHGDNVGVSDGRRPSAAITDHQPVEMQEQYFPDGSVSVRIEGRLDHQGNFVEHGTTTNFWENQKKKSQVNYVQGIRHGPRTAWYQSGQIWSHGAFVNGREDGTWTVWFQNGRKAQELHFDHGAWHGTETGWHINGVKKMQLEWVNGKRQGMLTFWDEQGNVVRETEFVDNVAQP